MKASAVLPSLIAITLSAGAALPIAHADPAPAANQPQNPDANAQPNPQPRPRLLPGGLYRADQLIVKLRDGLHIRARDGSLDDFGSGALQPLRNNLTNLTHQGARWRQAYPNIPEARLDQLRRNAEHTLKRQIPDQNLTFIIELTPATDTLEAAATLRALPQVEWVILDSVPAPAPSGPTAGVPDFVPQQQYRASAPAGVGASDVASMPGGTGAGVAIVDIEYSWNLAHKDLPTGITAIGAPGVDPFNDPNHGTAVLGELASQPNGIGTTGIAPDATIHVAPANFAFGYSPASAILSCVAALNPGDVILIEQQTFGPRYTGNPPGTQFGYLPLEWRNDVYNATQIAVGNFITVVAAAGNGSQNLDDPIYSTGNGGHWPFLPQNDSGAIIVGAGAWSGSGSPRSALWFTNHGATVDLQGWGEAVYTTGYGGLFSAFGVNLWFTSSFSGTSSASPIVAGAAALLQSIVKAETGGILTPAQVRQFLRDSGTPKNGSQEIGPLPNVLAAAALALGEPLPPPSPFTLNSPADGAAAIPMPVSLAWSASTGATSYRVIADDDADLSSPFLDIQNQITPFILLDQSSTPPLTTIYWSVTASGLGGTTASTPAISSFTTAAVLPGPFAMTSPNDGAIISTTTPTLRWQSSAGASSYRVRLSTSLNLASPIIDVSDITAGELLIAPGLLANSTRYYWSVSATNLGGTVTASPSVITFAIVLSPCMGDANGDRAINFADITSILAHWLMNYQTAYGPGDSNGDRRVDFVDITTTLGSFLTSCP